MSCVGCMPPVYLRYTVIVPHDPRWETLLRFRKIVRAFVWRKKGMVFATPCLFKIPAISALSMEYSHTTLQGTFGKVWPKKGHGCCNSVYSKFLQIVCWTWSVRTLLCKVLLVPTTLTWSRLTQLHTQIQLWMCGVFWNVTVVLSYCVIVKLKWTSLLLLRKQMLMIMEILQRRLGTTEWISV